VTAASDPTRRGAVQSEIRIENARSHNLKGVSCRIPLRRWTVITGVSGSGKSTLAFDTLFAEGQRRFVSSLSTYARQFLERLPRPEVDSISNLPPAIAIEQRNSVTNARSTVGTATELLDHLRILFARAGETRCPDCERPVLLGTASGVAEHVLATMAGERISIATPVVPAPGEDARSLRERLLREGHRRLLDASDRVIDLESQEPGELDALRGSALLLIDRLAVPTEAEREAGRARLAEAIAAAFARSDGEVVLVRADRGRPAPRVSFREGFRCDGCGRRFAKPAPGLFSFNSPLGACPTCQGFGRVAGIDLARVAGTGPSGRITREDLAAAMTGRDPGAAHSARGATPAAQRTGTEEIKVIGLRRVIAQRMSEAKRNIPHFAYVEEVDVTELEALRRHLNGRRPEGAPSLTYLPFLVAALVRALRQFPQCNASYDAERNVLVRHNAVHAGIATQTPDGLKVPVVRHAEARGLWDLAAEMRRVSEAARTNKATREELSGSTITVTSLGKLGGIVSTPIINAPELAIIGVNKAVERPVVVGGAVAVRLMMNLSSSFDHRFVDGFDAAAMIQVLKEMLEHPATIFIPE